MENTKEEEKRNGDIVMTNTNASDISNIPIPCITSSIQLVVTANLASFVRYALSFYPQYQNRYNL